MSLINSTYLIMRCLFFILVSPLLIIQVCYVKRYTLRLPVANTEDIHNQQKADLQLLHLGESTVAGVGVTHIKQGLTHTIGEQLEQETGLIINRQVVAENGATLSMLNTLKPQQPKPDILLITLGVNDTSKLTSRRQWREQLQLCCDTFANEATQVYFTQVPNMALFPALPFPLSYFLGLRSKVLDSDLQQLCAKSNWHYVSTSLPIKPDWMAQDGYHPNAMGYQIWAEEIAKAMGRSIDHKQGEIKQQSLVAK